jgi:hypothetical protein
MNGFAAPLQIFSTSFRVKQSISDAMTLSTTILSIMILSITILIILTLSIMILSIMTMSITILIIMTVSIMIQRIIILSITILSMALSRNHKESSAVVPFLVVYLLHVSTSDHYELMLTVLMLSVVMLSVLLSALQAILYWLYLVQCLPIKLCAYLT